jgi:AcrR family transcriptional regulator
MSDHQPTDSRERIVRAAARVFAEAGYRGATTRRIAQVAGVNEVTIFRHFGSKDELIREAVGRTDEAYDERPTLPEEPSDPFAELTEFARLQLDHLFRVRSFIRTCMGEGEERPEIMSRASDRPLRLHRELRRYLARLKADGVAAPTADTDVAATVLMGALFSDAMGRDFMPDAFPYAIDEAPRRYTGLILGAIGVRDERTAKRAKAEER